jgi:hypothetical protein
LVQSDDSRLYEHDSHETSTFAMLRYELNVHESGNALSMVATYPFSTMAMSMALIEESSGDVIELELTASLEGDKDESVISMDNNMASYIEVPALEKGKYFVEIAL